jgi:lambda repressor-like predicted transcriptional regulator
MENKFIDWHPADIIAGLRKKGRHWQNRAAMV